MERILVTEHGRVVGEYVPPPGKEPPTGDTLPMEFPTGVSGRMPRSSPAKTMKEWIEEVSDALGLRPPEKQ
jgi:hypothetical protein